MACKRHASKARDVCSKRPWRLDRSGSTAVDPEAQGDAGGGEAVQAGHAAICRAETGFVVVVQVQIDQPVSAKTIISDQQEVV